MEAERSRDKRGFPCKGGRKERLTMRVDGNVNETCGGLRDCLLEVANEVCGKTKGIQRHSETWWWNSEVGKVIYEKRRLLKIYEISKKGLDKAKITVNRDSYEQVIRKSYRGQGKKDYKD